MALVLFVALLFAPLIAEGTEPDRPSPFPTAAEQSFLKEHWPASIALQGPAPTSYSLLESSLAPSSCGSCHPQQYKDWQTTLHSRAMGPGVLGQLLDLVASDPATARLCWSCHTPLAEQQDLLQDADGEWRSNIAFDRKLQHQGLVCAGCHVRQHQRHGPPRRASPEVVGKITTATDGGTLPHGGFTAQSAFTKSAFCSRCHQFGADDYALNGKLLENTYEEWKQSDYPAKNIQCQGCHMPDRRHLWRGIHDPAMVKSGVDITIEVNDANYLPGKNFNAAIRVTNSGTGHYFPTYLTPKIIVQGYFVDSTGSVIQHSLQEATIGREVTLDLSQELFDTRIPPGDTLTINYVYPVPRAAVQFKVQVYVYPDHFYTRFYEAALADTTPSKGRALLQKALVNARESSYLLHEKTVPLRNLTGTNEVGQRPPPVSVSAEAGSTEKADAPDWNGSELRWFDYEHGLHQAKLTGKPILLLLYADWCPTCHAYKAIFYNPEIVQQAKKMILVRVDIERFPLIDNKYQLDGEYVPRTFVLDASGKVMHSALIRKRFPRYFTSPDNIAAFIGVMKRALVEPG